MIEEIGLLMTDTHLMESTVDINISIFEQARDICLEKGLTRIYHLGDVFDSRKAQTQEMFVVLDSIFEMLQEAELELVIICGNHDKTNYESGDSFLLPFKHYPNVQIIDYYIPIKLEDYKLTVHLMPFFDEKSGLYADILQNNQEITAGDTNILLTHIGVNEAKMNSGTIIEESIDKDLFEHYDKVYVGHFHDYQIIKGGKVIYIGSAYQENFGEDNKKGFQILKSDGSIEFIKSKFPEYKKISIDVNTKTKAQIDELKTEYANSEDNIRFNFTGSKEKLAKLDKQEFISLGIDFKSEEVATDVVDYDSQQVVTFNKDAINQEWTEFTKDEPEHQKTGLELLKAS